MKQLLLAMIIFISLVPAIPALESKKAAVFISDTIKPYFEAVKGLEAYFENKEVMLKIVELKDQDQAEFDDIGRDLLEKGYVYWAAIGPKATEIIYACRLPDVSARVYSMVLDPEVILVTKPVDFCGVSLQIPPVAQAEEIAGLFSPPARVGIIFDPAYNQAFTAQAVKAFEARGRILELLPVASRREVPYVLAQGVKKINLLWMIPDQTVISESIIQYIIKQAMQQGIGVIGYNRYFLNQGAVAAFVIDYEKVGGQTGEILEKIMDYGSCKSSDPLFVLNVNSRLMKILGLGKSDSNREP